MKRGLLCENSGTPDESSRRNDARPDVESLVIVGRKASRPGVWAAANLSFLCARKKHSPPGAQTKKCDEHLVVRAKQKAATRLGFRWSRLSTNISSPNETLRLRTRRCARKLPPQSPLEAPP